ncbi:hypothetical protein NDS46_31805 (plasmid) [Paenibacillus thiaminolyticus]|uniref:hypothetical protein n=1 Tax=Paenibacillus thiaminolyticus TaxID=49283 RepID=UPI00232C93EE|nr:hypothetical protein [Paenibacillus thiaminolyticus]WCF11544.1 hypothetical protein NDS46_31805 [Paenibacillus thiaminolyticus]
MTWIKRLFKKSNSPQPLTIGNHIFHSLAFVGIIDDRACSQFDRSKFLNNVTIKAYEARLSKCKKPSHIKYWYDSPVGNQAMDTYKLNKWRKAKNSIVGYSGIFLGNSEMYEIANEMTNILEANGNMVLILPLDRYQPYEREVDATIMIEHYLTFFPQASILRIGEADCR